MKFIEEAKGVLKKRLTLFLVCAFLVTFVLSVLYAIWSMPETDTFYMYDTGRWIVQNGEVPKTNPFIMHEGFEMIVQQWAFAVGIYHIFNLFGYTGLFVMVLFFLISAIVLMYILLGFYTKNINVKLIACMLFMYMYNGYTTCRPQIVTFCLLLVTMIILESYRKNGRKWILFFLPIISLIVINTHASFWSFVFVIMLPYVCPNIIRLINDFKAVMKDWWKEWHLVLLIMLVMIAVGFVNPNGIKGMGYLFLSYGTVTNIGIGELEAPTILSEDGLFILFGIILILLYVAKYKKDVDAAPVYMSLGTILLAATHLRNGWMPLLGVPLLLVSLLNDVSFINQTISQKTKKIILTICPLIMCLIAVFSASTHTFHIWDYSTTPVVAANYLDQFTNTEDITICADMRTSAYLQFRGYRPYIDSRPEMFSKKINGKENIITEWNGVVNGSVENIQIFLDKYEFSHIIAIRGSSLSYYLYNCDSYTQAVNGYGYILYERVDWVGYSKLAHS